MQRLAGRDVGVDRVVVEVGEDHEGRRDGRDGALTTGAGEHDRVTGAQDTRAAAHGAPPAYGVLGVVGLAEGDAVEVEDRIASDHDCGLMASYDVSDRKGFRLRQGRADLGRRGATSSDELVLEGVLVDAAHDDLRLDPGRAQQRSPGR